MASRRQSTDLRELPAYGLTEASRYLGIPAPTLKSWLVGRDYKTSIGTQRFEPIIRPAGTDPLTLSFTNLVEAQVLGVARRVHNLSLDNVRSAVRYMESKAAVPRPLANVDFLTNDRELFVSLLGGIVNASREGQRTLPGIVQDCLRRIERDESGLALRLYPLRLRKKAASSRVVMIDPRISFGRPCLAGTGIPIEILAERFRAGDTVDELAEDYARAKEEIAQAIEWEKAA